jgi:hypothetical protein
VGDSDAEGRVGSGVGGSGVGNGTCVSNGFTGPEETAVLTSAVIAIGVDSPAPPLAGMIGAQAVSNIKIRMVKVVRIFISDSFFLRTYRENVLFP